MFGVFYRKIRQFRHEEKGVVLILFILLIVPLLLVIAVGMDVGQTLIVKRQLTAAIDSAALTLGKLPDIIDQDDLNSKAEAYIRAHYPVSAIGNLTTFSVTRVDLGNGGSRIDISATAEVATSFMRIGGVDSLTVTVNAQVLRQENFLEVVMVLDNSGSMSGSKLTALKTAANTLVDILFGADAVSEKVRIGLVPFVGGVNVNVPHTTSWLDSATPAPINSQYINDLAAGQSMFDVLASMNGGIAARWGGCVRSRYNAGVDNLDTTDTPPDPASPETLFSAYFNPYRSTIAPHSKSLYVNQSSNSQNYNCTSAPIQPLTNVKSTITSAIAAMTAGGNTNIPEGLAWGWRLISPGEPLTEGQGYDQQQVIKAIIVLTDGENNGFGFSSYGKPEAVNPQIGTNHQAALNTRLSTICANIKADKDGNNSDEDILLYAITFNVSGPIETLMQNCASPGRFFDSPTVEDLQAAFRSIASGLNQLRIMK
jgi:Flp pilus assembly protein TadG